MTIELLEEKLKLLCWVDALLIDPMFSIVEGKDVKGVLPYTCIQDCDSALAPDDKYKSFVMLMESSDQSLRPHFDHGYNTTYFWPYTLFVWLNNRRLGYDCSIRKTIAAEMLDYIPELELLSYGETARRFKALAWDSSIYNPQYEILAFQIYFPMPQCKPFVCLDPIC